MKMKKAALRGMILLAAVVTLCMFFARTIQTITTAKVQIVSPSNGRFEEKIMLQAQIHFPETQEIGLLNAFGLEVKVKDILVSPGDYVDTGDLLFVCEIMNQQEKTDALQAEYTLLSERLIQLDMANRKQPKTTKQNDLYAELMDANGSLLEKTYAARRLARQQGVDLYGALSSWPEQLAGQSISVDLQQAIDQANAANNAYQLAYDAFFNQLSKQEVRDAVFAYINERNSLISNMEELMSKMVELDAEAERLANIVAPYAGHIVSIGVAEGQRYVDLQAACVMTAEGSAPILRASLQGENRSFENGTRVNIVHDTYGPLQGKVLHTSTDRNGVKLLDISLPEEWLVTEDSALQYLLANGVKVSINYRAKNASTLLPPSALRGETGNHYVYTIQKTYGGLLSGSSMKLFKTNVTVLDKSDTVVSVAEDLSRMQIADREDRVIAEGQTVMEYVK